MNYDRENIFQGCIGSIKGPVTEMRLLKPMDTYQTPVLNDLKKKKGDRINYLFQVSFTLIIHRSTQI